eukprot:269491-Amphidinium_carterae.1
MARCIATWSLFLSWTFTQQDSLGHCCGKFSKLDLLCYGCGGWMRCRDVLMGGACITLQRDHSSRFGHIRWHSARVAHPPCVITRGDFFA